MNLEEAIKLLKKIRDAAKQNVDYIENCKLTDFLNIKYDNNKQEYEAIDTVLNELGRLKSDLYSANCIIEDLLNNENKWKSVNNELPKEEAKVLVCSNWQDIQQNIQLGYIYSGVWYTWEKNEVIDFVSYWMELPESPKEEE